MKEKLAYETFKYYSPIHYQSQVISLKRNSCNNKTSKFSTKFTVNFEVRPLFRITVDGLFQWDTLYYIESGHSIYIGMGCRRKKDYYYYNIM